MLDLANSRFEDSQRIFNVKRLSQGYEPDDFDKKPRRELVLLGRHQCCQGAEVGLGLRHGPCHICLRARPASAFPRMDRLRFMVQGTEFIST